MCLHMNCEKYKQDFLKLLLEEDFKNSQHSLTIVMCECEFYPFETSSMKTKNSDRCEIQYCLTSLVLRMSHTNTNILMKKIMLFEKLCGLADVAINTKQKTTEISLFFHRSTRYILFVIKLLIR